MPLDSRFSIEPLMRLITLVLVAVVVILLGRLTWMIIEPSSILPAADGSRLDPVASGPASAAMRGYDDVAALSVFGAAPKSAANVINAPETSLSWVLKGVLADPDPERSGAILAPQGQPEKYYRVGDDLPGSVRLDQVLADRVILARDGKLDCNAARCPPVRRLQGAPPICRRWIPTSRWQPTVGWRGSIVRPG
jgi:general secretion pathway protein C